MRRIVILLLIMTIAVPAGFARKKQDKSGDVEGLIYTDSKYDFKLTLPEDWKYNLRKDKEDFRLVLTKKNYEIPPDYLSSPDYTMVPRITVWVGQTPLSPFEFVDSMLSRTYKSEAKSDIFKEFEILNDNISEQGNVREKLTTRSKKAMEIDGKKAFLWEGQMMYRKDIAESASSIGGRRVYGKYGGAIFMIIKDKDMYAFHLICEWNYFETNLIQFMDFVSSIKWEE